jgi:hypothetical protein
MYLLFMIEKVLFFILLVSSSLFVVQGYLKFNIIWYLSKFTHPHFTTVVYVISSIAILYNLFRRNYYLPFLGNTVYPCNSLTLKTPENANVMRKVSDLRPNVNVVFWASESSEDKVIDNPWDAYDTYSNAGVTISDSNGNATFMVRTPTPYKIPSGFVLDNHIHYRECIGKGILGPVKTVML